jgi:hypothetical protein
MTTSYVIDSPLWWQDVECLHPVMMHSIWQVYELYKGSDDTLAKWNASKQKWNKVRNRMVAGWGADVDVDKALKPLSVATVV